MSFSRRFTTALWAPASTGARSGGSTLWHSWEGLRATGELTAMATWSVQYLYPIMDRVMAESGPFRGCQPDERHRKGEHKDDSAPHPGRVLPTTPPPPELVDERQ